MSNRLKPSNDFAAMALQRQMDEDPTIPIVDIRNVPPTAEKVDVSDTPPEYLPVNKAIWVKPDQRVERVQGKIVIPNGKDGKKEERTGTVLDSASDLCKAGDRVIWARVSAIDIHGETRFVVQGDDLIGVKPCSPTS